MGLELRAGELVLGLAPETGGAIAYFTFRGVELLRPVIDPRLLAQRGQAVAAYPLIPFANRIAWGRFSFRGQDFQLARNFGDNPHTIHGNAWMRPWTVVESGDARARMVLENVPARDAAAEWPFAYLAEQVFELGEDGVAITLSVRNTDSRPWPAGLGLHPYVARTPQARLRFEADTIWMPGADGLPAAREAVAGVYEFAGDEQLGAIEIDACYAGWGGSASVALPEDGLTLVLEAGPPLDHLQLYTPAGRDFMGLEPVTNMPDAINRMEDVADQGLVVLAPGEMLTAVVRMGVRAAGAVERERKNVLF